MTIVTCRTVRDVDKAPNLENTVRNDAHWLMLDLCDYKIAKYETYTDESGVVRSRRVKIDASKP